MRINNQGFSALEIVIVIAFVVFGFSGLLVLAVRNSEAEYTNKNDFIATSLAQEGLEAVRRIRDYNLAQSLTFYTSLNSGTADTEYKFIINYDGTVNNTVTSLSNAGANLKIDATTGYYNITSGTTSKFNRLITTTYRRTGASPYTKECLDIKAEVSWQDGLRTNTQTLLTKLCK